MVLKKLYIQLITLWKNLMVSYDNSIIGKTLSKICTFFEKEAGSSSVLRYFREKFLDMSLIRYSIIGKIISLPFTILRTFYERAGHKFESVIKESKSARFIGALPYVQLRMYGFFMLFAGLGALISSPLTGGINGVEIIVALAFALCGLIFLPAKLTLYNAFCTSSVAKLIARLAFSDDFAPSEKEISVISAKTVSVVALVLGLIFGAINFPYMSLIAFVLLIAGIVLYKTSTGIFLLIMAAPILPTMAVAGLACLCIVSYALHLAFSQKATYGQTPFTVIIAAFLILLGITSATGAAPSSSMPAFFIYLIFTLCFPVIVNTITSEKQWKALIAAFAVSAFFVSIYGVIQNLIVSNNLDERWVDPDMFEDIKTRVFSTLANPNILGQFLILSIPFTLACTIYCKDSKARLLYAAVLFAMVACLWFTWSRSSWVGVILAIVIMLTKKDYRFLGVCFAGILLLMVVLPQSIISRLTSIGNTGDTSTAYRISVWLGSLEVAKNNFLTGVGLGAEAFGAVYKNYALSAADFAQHAHNFYIQLVCDMGVGGLLIFAFMILAAYKAISVIGKGSKLTNLVAYALAGSLVGYLFQGMAETMWYNYRMLLVFWIFMAFIQSASTLPTLSKGADCVD